MKQGKKTNNEINFIVPHFLEGQYLTFSKSNSVVWRGPQNYNSIISQWSLIHRKAFIFLTFWLSHPRDGNNFVHISLDKKYKRFFLTMLLVSTLFRGSQTRMKNQIIAYNLMISLMHLCNTFISIEKSEGKQVRCHTTIIPTLCEVETGGLQVGAQP